MWEGQSRGQPRYQMCSCFMVLDPAIQDVASRTPSSEGEDTKDKGVKGKIPAGTAAPIECFIF